MSRIRIRIRRALDRGLEATLAALMGGMVLVVLWQIVTRFVLRSPSSVTEELVRFALLWLALLGASYGFGRNTHLAIELLPSRVNAERRTVLELGVLVSVGGFAVLVLVVGGLRLVATTLALGQSSAALGIERGYVYLALPVSGLVVLAYVALAGVERLQRRGES